MADIDLAIRYTDTDMKRLEADLDRVRTSAVTIQTTLDKINLKNLEKQFQSLGKVAMNAFGRGLQTRITGVTTKIFAQQQAIRGLITQYALLAAAQKAPVPKKGFDQLGTTSGKSAQYGTTSYQPSKTSFEDFESELGAGKPMPFAASTKKYEDMILRRSLQAKDVLHSEKSIAELAKQYSVSESTIRRDQAARIKNTLEGYKKMGQYYTKAQVETIDYTKSKFAGTQPVAQGIQQSKLDQIQQMYGRPTSADVQKSTEASIQRDRSIAAKEQIKAYKSLGQYYAKPQAKVIDYTKGVDKQAQLDQIQQMYGKPSTAATKENVRA
ncbi:MAG TPA: hypothetical protein VMW25_02095, partial [Clostridia bacterium]|nr:hypothetical protein [Clostridia bacterium]